MSCWKTSSNAMDLWWHLRRNEGVLSLSSGEPNGHNPPRNYSSDHCAWNNDRVRHVESLRWDRPARISSSDCEPQRKLWGYYEWSSYMNTVEGLWSQARAKNRRRFGTHRQMMILICVSLCGIREFEISFSKIPSTKSMNI